MQWLYDGWGRLDWPNLIGGLVLGGIGYLFTWKVLLPLWNKSHETSKLLLHKRQKEAVLRDIRLIKKFKSGQLDIYLWCAVRLAGVILGCMAFLGMLILGISLVVFAKMRAAIGVPSFDIWDYPFPLGAEEWVARVLAFAMGIDTAILMKHVLDIRRIVRYYSYMDEFKEQAKKILSFEDLKLLD